MEIKRECLHLNDGMNASILENPLIERSTLSTVKVLKGAIG
jgi:hypothetical protein